MKDSQIFLFDKMSLNIVLLMIFFLHQCIHYRFDEYFTIEFTTVCILNDFPLYTFGPVITFVTAFYGNGCTSWINHNLNKIRVLQQAKRIAMYTY